jgi:hypothetical protein
MEFPIHAKHPDGSVWYKILSSKHFLEWKRIGVSQKPEQNRYLKSEVIAQDYSAALYIQDLIKSIEEGALLRVDEFELS